MTLYRLAQGIARTLWPLVGRLRVQGLEHVPAEGPFLLVANHQSYLDPVLIQAVCPRPVAAMAKSTQFNSAPMRWLLTRLHSFPVRRFQIDPQAVRLALRRLEAGQGVAIYIEGERSWDARLQSPRRGTLHLALKAGVPVIPCAISGSYDAMPRWHTALRRADVTIRFGRPLDLPRSDDRRERERLIEPTAERVMGAIAGLMLRPAG